MRPNSRADFTIAIICALPFEADAVEALFDETYDRLGQFYGVQTGDTNAYMNGRVGGHNIVLSYMPAMGKGSAASVASSLRTSYTQITLALVVGICGGAPYPSNGSPQIFLGDVIISNAVIEYDFGRQSPDVFEGKTGVLDTLSRPNNQIRTLLAGLNGRRNHSDFEGQMMGYLREIQQSEPRWQLPDFTDDVLFKRSYHHKHHDKRSSSGCCCFNKDLPNCICEVALQQNCNQLRCNEDQVSRRRDSAEAVKASMHIGIVASADTVMKSGEHRDEIVRDEKVIGFEMEGAGVWENVPCIIIKGVCDYADSHKSKAWQAYAAATGASAAKTFLKYWNVTAREDKKGSAVSGWSLSEKTRDLWDANKRLPNSRN